VTFVLQDLSGTRFTLDIASIPAGSTIKAVVAPDAANGFIPYYRQQTNQNYWFTYLESSRTLYFAYNVCAEQAGLRLRSSTINSGLPSTPSRWNTSSLMCVTTPAATQPCSTRSLVPAQHGQAAFSVRSPSSSSVAVRIPQPSLTPLRSVKRRRCS
jgi:hypothetical protein